MGRLQETIFKIMSLGSNRASDYVRFNHISCFGNSMSHVHHVGKSISALINYLYTEVVGLPWPHKSDATA